MKKIITLLLCLFTSTIVVKAQENAFFIGPAGGVNLSKFKYVGDDFSGLTTKPLFGLNAGLTFGIEFKRLAIVSGAQFLQRGTKLQTENVSYDTNGDGYADIVGFASGKERENIISVPFLLRYRLFNEKFGATLSIGPSFNIGLNGNGEVEFEATDVNYSDRDSYTSSFGNGINQEYKRLQVGFLLSPGVYFGIGEQGRLNLNLMWDLGSDMFNKRYKDAYDIEYKQIARSTILSITYEHRFQFGDKY